jgi:hypothetical protein
MRPWEGEGDEQEPPSSEHSRAFGKEPDMEDGDPKFFIFGDVFDGYWWRLRSVSGETIESSGRIHLRKAECEREVQRLKEERYPYGRVRDATIG